jgi:glycosyltransferase involved in cell wall biosynthesis
VAVESSGLDETYAWDAIAGTDQFGRVTLFDRADAQTLPRAKVVSKVALALDKIQPEVVFIPGWADSCALGALKWSAHNNVPAILMSETTPWDEKRVWWKEWVKQKVIGLCASALAGGTPHKDYLIRLGLASERVFLGYDAVDNAYFADKAEESRKQRVEIRKRYDLPENYFVASARFVEKKNLTRLIQAFARYRQLAAKAEGGKPKAGIWGLVLLGDGPLKSDLARLISDLGLQPSVRLPGFKQYPDLPSYYGLAGAFVHASTTEQWGLVVNEAMASGLPVLVSNRCGCASDLVKVGINGFTFNPFNVEQLAQLMFEISVFPPLQLSAFGDASRQIIAHWGPERFAQGLKEAAETALKNTRSRAGLMDRLLLQLLLLR